MKYLHSSSLRFSALVCGIFVLMGQVAAQQQQDQKKEQAKEKIQSLPEVIVKDTMTVTGTSMATDLQTYPGSVSVVTPQQLDVATTPIDALRNVAGVFTGNDLGAAWGNHSIFAVSVISRKTASSSCKTACDAH